MALSHTAGHLLSSDRLENFHANDGFRLIGAPGFDRNKWPHMADAAGEAGIHAYHRTAPGSALPGA